MILENQYGKVFPLKDLADPSTEDLAPSDEKHDPNRPCVNWQFKPGLAPEPEYGYVPLLRYDPFGKKGLVRDERGRPVRLPYFITEDQVLEPNPYPVTNRGRVIGGPPRPMRKLEENEDILPDGAMGGYMVVDVTTKIITPEQELDLQSDETLQLVRENNQMLKQLTGKK